MGSKAWTFLTLYLLIILPVSVGAVSVGVNKATIHFSKVLRGGYAEDTFTVTTGSPEETSLEYQFVGEAADWLRLLPENESDLVFSASKPLTLTVIVEPPVDAANGTYQAELRILTGPVVRTGGKYGSSVRASFGVKISVEVVGEEVRSCIAGGFNIPDTEVEQPLELQASVKNTGNVQLLPTFNLDVWDQYQTKLVMTKSVTADSRILPTKQETLFFQLSQDLPVGQYWARIEEPDCKGGGFLTFNVLERGGVSDKGELLRIDTKPWAGTDEIVRIAAVFQNLGARTVTAKFKGVIERDGRIVEAIETDPLNVKPSSVAELETFFNPEEPGQYQVKGRVVYNNKLTFEKSSVINVKPSPRRVTGSFLGAFTAYNAATVLVFLGIVFLLLLIRKEKRRYY